MDRVAAPLRSMGLGVEGLGQRTLPPLTVIRGSGTLRSIDFEVPVPSAQVKSAILLAALQADAPSRVVERVRTRANTEEMLHDCGIDITSSDDDAGRTVWIRPGRPAPTNWHVPGDPSQAAFFVVLGLLSADARLSIEDLYPGEERTGFLRVLERMGGEITRHESNGTLRVEICSSSLVATTVESREIPSVDEVPVLAVAAAAASGTTRFVSVGELRIKESDRFAGTIALVNSLGARARGEGDDLIVEGVGSATNFEPVDFAGALDHRMVMSAAVAASSGAGGQLRDVDTVSSSYPDFFADLASLR
jgi:3-phosphoshikimate 1-carboxyvinyltransferase